MQWGPCRTAGRVWRHLAFIGCLTLTAGGARAATTATITDLGPPTNDVPNYVPLGAFHRIRTTLRQGAMPEFLFIGTQIDAKSAVERWAAVKALDQFGTFSGIAPSLTSPCLPKTHVSLGGCGEPTFDWEHARYRSRYVALWTRT